MSAKREPLTFVLLHNCVGNSVPAYQKASNNRKDDEKIKDLLFKIEAFEAGDKPVSNFTFTF